MKKLCLILSFVFVMSGCLRGVEVRLPRLSSPNQSQLAYIGEDGRLEYESWSDRGDILIDYSHAGYKNGGVRLPDVPTVIRLSPRKDAQDDTERIQAAIDKVSEREPDEDGFRGAVLLQKGRYPVKGTLRISQSGVVLRGEGQSKNGTVIYAAGKRHSGTKQSTVIRISGGGTFKRLEKTRTKIVDEYVPVGTRSFEVENPEHFKPEMKVQVYRPATQKWLDDIRMSKIVEDYNNPDCVNWTTSRYSMYWLRKVQAVEGNRITIDAPIVQSIDAEYGGGELAACEPDRIISNTGIENLYIESRFDPEITRTIRGQKYYSDEDHAWTAIMVSNARDGWIKNVTSIYMGYSTVHLSSSAYFFTVQDCISLEPVSQISGARRYSFANSGQRNFFQRCRASNGRHDFVLHSQTKGPNVFLDCKASQVWSVSEPHHRWSQGAIWDNVSLTDNGLMAVNRGDSGTGHGWAGVQMCFWNCDAPFIIVLKPPFEQNFAIGVTGYGVFTPGVPKSLRQRNSTVNWVQRQAKTKIENHPDRTILGNGWIESYHAPVTPRSLYLQQLKDRLGIEAVENITEPWQRAGLR